MNIKYCIIAICFLYLLQHTNATCQTKKQLIRSITKNNVYTEIDNWKLQHGYIFDDPEYFDPIFDIAFGKEDKDKNGVIVHSRYKYYNFLKLSPSPASFPIDHMITEG